MRYYTLKQLEVKFNRNATQIWEALCRYGIAKTYNGYPITAEQLHDIKIFLDKKQRRKRTK